MNPHGTRAEHEAPPVVYRLGTVFSTDVERQVIRLTDFWPTDQDWLQRALRLDNNIKECPRHFQRSRDGGVSEACLYTKETISSVSDHGVNLSHGYPLQTRPSLTRLNPGFYRGLPVQELVSDFSRPTDRSDLGKKPSSSYYRPGSARP